jgi:hypothetical protein
MPSDRLFHRVSPRQAIVAHYFTDLDEWARPFALPLVLDLLESLVEIDGVSIMVACDDPQSVEQLSVSFPAGVDYLAAPGGVANPNRWQAEQMVQRGFERFVILAADAIGLSSRLVSTAMSVLGSAESVAATTPAGCVWLAGVRADAISQGSAQVEALLGAMATGNQVEHGGPRLGRRMRLRDLNSAAQVFEEAQPYAPLVPRTLAAYNLTST